MLKKDKKPSIELEYRACITEKDFVRLRSFFSKNATLLGDDSKDTYFFIWPKRVVKVVFNPRTKVGKIALKPGRIGKQGHFKEYELTLKPNELETAIEFFKVFEPSNVQYVYQFRTNYIYKGVKLALKYTESWGFHIELEIMINSLSKKRSAEQKIRAIAMELGLGIMSDAELKDYTERIDKGYMFGQYPKEKFPYRR